MKELQAGGSTHRIGGQNLVAACAAIALAMAGVLVLGLGFINEPLARHLGQGQGVTLLYYAIYQGVGALALSVVARPLVAWLGIGGAALAGGLWTTGVLVAMSMTSSLVGLYVAAAGLGLLIPIVANYLPPLVVMRTFRRRRGAILGLVMGLSGLGGLILGLVMPRVIGEADWSAGFGALAAYIAILTVPTALILWRWLGKKGEPAAREPVGVRTVSSLRRAGWGPLVVVMLATTVFHITQGIYQHFPVVMAEHGVSKTSGGSLVAMSSVVIMVVSPVVGWAADRFGAIETAVVLIVIYVLGLIGIFAAGGLAALVVPVFGFAVGTTTPFVLGALLIPRVLGSEGYERNLALFVACLPIGSALGAPLWGIVIDVTGSYDAALLGSAVAAAILAILLIWAKFTYPRLAPAVVKPEAT